MQRPKALPAWTPFARTHLAHLTIEQMDRQAAGLARRLGLPHAAALHSLRMAHADEIWCNSRYQVNISRDPGNGSGPGLVHLSIKRLDKQPLGPERYRDFMRIKDELVGPDCEGVEIYPSRKREVDTANQYHLWCFDRPGFRIGIGFNPDVLDARLVLNGTGVPDFANSIQSPMEDHHVR